MCNMLWVEFVAPYHSIDLEWCHKVRRHFAWLSQCRSLQESVEAHFLSNSYPLPLTLMTNSVLFGYLELWWAFLSPCTSHDVARRIFSSQPVRRLSLWSLKGTPVGNLASQEGALRRAFLHWLGTSLQWRQSESHPLGSGWSRLQSPARLPGPCISQRSQPGSACFSLRAYCKYDPSVFVAVPVCLDTLATVP